METAEIRLIKKIHMIFKSKRLSLSVAESCTAGLISHMLTLLPGASEFFDSSIICYSSESKQRLLNIKEAQIKKHGTVSEETAIAMAEMVRKKTGADVSLSITGNLGPVPIENRKAGLVFIAVSFNRGTESKGMIFDGSRNEIKQSASVAALEFLYEVVSVWT